MKGTMWVESYHKQISTNKVTTRFNKLIHILNLFFSGFSFPFRSETFFLIHGWLAVGFPSFAPFMYMALSPFFCWQSQRGQRSVFRVLVDVMVVWTHTSRVSRGSRKVHSVVHACSHMLAHLHTHKTVTPKQSQALYSCTELLCVVVLAFPAFLS